MEIERSRKRTRPSSPPTGTSQQGSNVSPHKMLALTYQPGFEAAEPEFQELFPRDFERLSISIDADFAAKLKVAGILSFNRVPDQRRPTIRYYTVNVEIFRDTITELITRYLTRKLYEAGSMPFANVDAEVLTMAPLVSNACMAALYAKLRTIHTQFQTYAGRYQARPSYTKDVELPLPLADAIQNFGIFSPVGTIINYVCVPTYPEGVQNEGRSTQNWSSYHYESYLPYLKQLGIPVKSVDTRLKTGSSWWTYKVNHVNGHYDLRCIFSPINYSDHTAMLAAMFMSINEDQQPQWVIEHLNTDSDFAVRLREVPEGIQIKMFGALCHAPAEEWSQYLLQS